jgi:pimeloyl-ACP methyl ester carboxylesterase
MVAMRYAREYDRARTLTLFDTAASGAAVDEPALRGLHPDDPAGLAASLDGAFSAAFREARPDLVDQICAWRRAEDADSDGVAAQAAAMTDFEAGPLYELTTPTLVCHGLDDPVVPVAAGEELAEGLPRGTFEPVEGRHLCFVEHARAVTERLLAHLDDSEGER